MVHAPPSGFLPTRPMMRDDRRPRGAEPAAFGFTERRLWWAEMGLAIVAAVCVVWWLALAPSPTATVASLESACVIASSTPDAAHGGRRDAEADKGPGARTR